jgi:hypothetical protein
VRSFYQDSDASKLTWFLFTCTSNRILPAVAENERPLLLLNILFGILQQYHLIKSCYLGIIILFSWSTPILHLVTMFLIFAAMV